jgi:hypothetical protein
MFMDKIEKKSIKKKTKKLLELTCQIHDLDHKIKIT